MDGFKYKDININKDLSLVDDREDYVVCPLESSHSIIAHRIQTHLVKCVKAHKNMSDEMVRCPFDNTHVQRVNQLVNHVATCPSRIIFDSFKYSMGEAQLQIEVPPMPVLPDVEEENWGDTDHPALDREKNMENKMIYRKKNGLTPSERRQFRQEQRMKFASRPELDISLPFNSPQLPIHRAPATLTMSSDHLIWGQPKPLQLVPPPVT